ncbi:MAG: hypothetical protein HYY06_00575 [Deltaproteobacteria bacterium]|nr:hypothetical protein [Deltaproteobacteria bacterium]
MKRSFMALALLSGCSRDVGTVLLTLVTSPNVEENPLPADQDLTIEVRVEGPGTGVRRASAPYVPGETRIDVPDVTVGEDRVFTVTVRLASGAVLARGRSLPVSLDGDDAVQLYLSRVNRGSQAYSPIAGATGLRAPRFRHVALPLPDGRVLVAGGARAIIDGSSTKGGDPADFAEIFDPTRGQIVTDQPDCVAGLDQSRCLFVPRIGPVSALDSDGAPLLAGGEAVNGPSPEGERFSEGRFVPAGALSAPRSWAAGFGTPSGVVVAGGLQIEGETLVPSGTAEVVSFGDRRTAGSLSVARWAAAAAALADGRGIVAGGFVDIVEPSRSCADEDDPDAFCRLGFLSATPCDTESGLCRGDRAGNVTDALDLFDPAAGSFRPVEDGLVVARAQASVTALPDGRFVIAGGLVDVNPNPDGAQNLPTASIEVYDPELDLSCEVGNLGHPRWLHAAVALGRSPQDARVAIFGGFAASGLEALDTVEIVDLRNVEVTSGCEGSLTRATEVPGLRLRRPRAGHTATMMANGAILVAGGTTGADPEIGTLEVSDLLEVFWVE